MDEETLPKFAERVCEALAVLCDEAPPAHLVAGWLACQGMESCNLQDWAASHTRIPWSMGITIIEAAINIASEPSDDLITQIGEDYLRRHGTQLPHLWWIE